MFDKAIQFLKDHKEVAFATSEGDFPKLRIFQIMKQEGHVLYFATSAKKAVYRELRQNPNIEILAFADNISVRCSGMVNFILFAYDCHYQLPGTTIIAVLAEVDALPGSQIQASVSNGNSEADTAQC